MIDNYRLDEFGTIHQINFTPITYDEKYISYYQAKSDRTIKLGYMRMGWVLGLLGHIPNSVLEIGYGTGTFIEAAQITGVRECAGCDIAAYPLPKGVSYLPWQAAIARRWDTVAMFDVLEHIPDLTFLRHLQTRYLAIAVPYCRWHEMGDAWFANWRMLLPNEHLHHFSPDSLRKTLAHFGFMQVTQNSFEDGLRLRPNETGPNIILAMFKKE